ncbi:hypothetical protein K9N50_10180 [bacterium]|nr:hypothetical protein [bacterium]
MKIDINLKRDSDSISSLIPGSAQISSMVKSISDRQLPTMWTKTTQKVIKVGAVVMVVIVVGAIIRHFVNRFHCNHK